MVLPSYCIIVKSLYSLALCHPIFSKSGPFNLSIPAPKMYDLFYLRYWKNSCFSGIISYVEDICEAVLSSVWEALSQEA